MCTMKRFTGVPRLAARVGAAVLLISAAVASPGEAQGWIDPPPGQPAALVKLRSDVRVTVAGRVAEVAVEEWFQNRGGGLAEGTYLYPLPGEAVFSNFSLFQGDRELRGETMDAGQARAIYEAIVRKRRDPALIELAGHGLIRARVFPIEAGQTRRITLRYTQVLERAGDAVQFRYAAGSAAAHGVLPRPVTTRRPAQDPTRTPTAEAAPLRFTLEAADSAFDRPFSPTHELRVERRDGRLRVTPVDDLAGDFSLFLPLRRPGVGLTLVTHRPSGEPGYFMLTLSPGTAEGPGEARDVTAVVDVSGSMSGEKLEQTKDALRQLLGSLRAEDRFRLIAFSNDVRTNADGWTRAGGDEIRRAREWVEALEASGGTNIAGALEEAFRVTSPEGRLPIVLFLTDGLPTVGDRDPERIAAEAEAGRGRARVFAFGVGYDVNTYLLDRLSAAARGSTAYVEPGEDVERAVSTLAAKVSHPVLTDLDLGGAPVRLTDIYPRTLPDLFAGEELVLFGRYEGTGRGDVRVRGHRGGRAEAFSVSAAFPDRSQPNDYIPRLWASRKLGELTRTARLEGSSPELVAEIRQTALRYGLLSEYTSYLVQEPPTVADGRPMPVNAPASMAAGNRIALESLVVTGQAAVKSAEAARLQREVTSAKTLEEAEDAMAARLDGSGVRVVAGRSFRQVGELWKEVTAGDSTRVVAIRTFSPAYFAILSAAPELKPIVAELEPVQVAGEELALRFGDEGLEQLSAAHAARLTRAFRGR